MSRKANAIAACHQSPPLHRRPRPPLPTPGLSRNPTHSWYANLCSPLPLATLFPLPRTTTTRIGPLLLPKHPPPIEHVSTCKLSRTERRRLGLTENTATTLSPTTPTPRLPRPLSVQKAATGNSWLTSCSDVHCESPAVWICSFFKFTVTFVLSSSRAFEKGWDWIYDTTRTLVRHFALHVNVERALTNGIIWSDVDPNERPIA